LGFVTCSDCVHRFSIWDCRTGLLRYEFQRGGTSCPFRGIFPQGAQYSRPPLTVFIPEVIPTLTAFVENYTSCFEPCCPFHFPILSAGHTDGDGDSSTADAIRAASKSCRR